LRPRKGEKGSRGMCGRLPLVSVRGTPAGTVVLLLFGLSGGVGEEFAHGGVGVDGGRDIGEDGTHFEGEDGFADHFGGAGADDAYAEDELGIGVEDDFGESIGAAEADGSSRGAPGDGVGVVVVILGTGFGFGEAAPGDLGIGEGDLGMARGSKRVPQPATASAQTRA